MPSQFKTLAPDMIKCFCRLACLFHSCSHFKRGDTNFLHIIIVIIIITIVIIIIIIIITITITIIIIIIIIIIINTLFEIRKFDSSPKNLQFD